MAVTITDIFAKQFSPRLLMLSQQKESRFASKVRLETVRNAEEAYFDTIAEEDLPEQAVVRHGPTPLSESTWGRRRVVPYKWHKGTMLDSHDVARMMGEPQGVVLQSFAASFGRKKDDLIIAAALGTAAIGKAGGSTVAFADESVSINAITGGTKSVLGTAAAVGTDAVTMELVKMLAMMEIFNEADVDPDIPKYWAVSPRDIHSMLDIDEVGSADYNTVKVLAQGKMDTYAGFNFFWTNRLLETGTGNDECYRTIAWAEDGIIMAYIGDLTTEISKRADLQNEDQIYSKMDLGAVRMEGAKVHECLTATSGVTTAV